MGPEGLRSSDQAQENRGTTRPKLANRATERDSKKSQQQL